MPIKILVIVELRSHMRPELGLNFDWIHVVENWFMIKFWLGSLKEKPYELWSIVD